MQNKFDLAVIGGGAAGLMAAGKAAELGHSVILIEKNKQLGVKLLITGKGRCNITNAEEDFKTLIQAYGKNGRFLYTAFTEFSNFNVINFFESRGLKTKTERGNRVFPLSDSAQDVVELLKRYVKHPKISIQLNTAVKNLVHSNINEQHKIIEKLVLSNGETIEAENYLIATGGKSYPRTGSSGEAYQWIKQLGHTIVDLKPVLTPIHVKENLVQQLEGLSLKNVEISLWNDKKIESFFGEALFTNNGLSGPIILSLSKLVNLNEIQKLKIDFKPALNHETLDLRLRRDFEEQKNKQFKNSLNQLLPSKLIPVIIELSGIDENKKVTEISKVERKRLLKLLKEFELTVNGLGGYDKAIVTSGGVNLKEVDPKTMKSKILDNLYFAGEVLDIDGPTGGYNLQVAWSTAFIAAHLRK